MGGGEDEEEEERRGEEREMAITGRVQAAAEDEFDAWISYLVAHMNCD